MLHTYHLLTIDLSMFGEGGEGAAPAGEGSAPAATAAPAPAEVRYGKQTETAAAPQQETTQASETPLDKGKQFAELIRGEYKDQYTEATQKLINRRFRDTDAKINAQQPIMDLLATRYGVADGDASKILDAVKRDTAFWQDAADAAGMTVEQYQKIVDLETRNRKNESLLNMMRTHEQAVAKNKAWLEEAEQVKQKYPEFDLEEAMQNDLFLYLLRKDGGNYPMEQAYRGAFMDRFLAQAAASAEKAVTDNIKARGSRPQEAGANATPGFTVKDDVSKLTGKEVLDSFNRILAGEKFSFG